MGHNYHRFASERRCDIQVGEAQTEFTLLHCHDGDGGQARETEDSWERLHCGKPRRPFGNPQRKEGVEVSMMTRGNVSSTRGMGDHLSAAPPITTPLGNWG